VAIKPPPLSDVARLAVLKLPRPVFGHDEKANIVLAIRKVSVVRVGSDPDILDYYARLLSCLAPSTFRDALIPIKVASWWAPHPVLATPPAPQKNLLASEKNHIYAYFRIANGHIGYTLL
jgi:hypothetical protein